VTHVVDVINMYKTSFGKEVVHILSDNLIMNINEIECQGLEWIELAQNAFQLNVILKETAKFWVPRKVRNFAIILPYY
jgi:hypothetical protein